MDFLFFDKDNTKKTIFSKKKTNVLINSKDYKKK